jgi:hypothetical protein
MIETAFYHDLLNPKESLFLAMSPGRDVLYACLKCLGAISGGGIWQ